MKLEGGSRTRHGYKHALSGKPLVSVVTVVLNGAQTIRDTIESVLRQEYGNTELIVIDGESSDGTVDILKEYDHAIDYWLSEKDRGIYDAMNKGISLCSGEYVGMLNSDDVFSGKNVVQDIADRLVATNADAVFSCLDIVDRENPRKILRKYRVTELSTELLRIGVMPPHPTFYCKRSCYAQGGMYKTEYRIAADFEMLVRMLVRQKISWEFIDNVAVLMRSGGVSNCGLKARITLNREVVRACRENGLYTNLLFLALKLPIRLYELIR